VFARFPLLAERFGADDVAITIERKFQGRESRGSV